MKLHVVHSAGPTKICVLMKFINQTHKSHLHTISGDMKPYNIQIPSTINWASSSPITSRGNAAIGNIFSHTPSYRSSNGSSGSTRRRRRAVNNNISAIANHGHLHKKSGST